MLPVGSAGIPRPLYCARWLCCSICDKPPWLSPWLSHGLPLPSIITPTLPVFLDEGELSAHRPERAAAWLAAAPRLFAPLGLQLAAHFAHLLPLLLGWALAPRPAVQAAALDALLLLTQLTWPRIGVHAAQLWTVLRRVHADEHARGALATVAGVGGDSGSCSVADRAEDCALALWCASGPTWQMQLLSDPGGQHDALLQAVMQRLEDDPAAAEADEGGAQAQQRAVPAG